MDSTWLSTQVSEYLPLKDKVNLAASNRHLQKVVLEHDHDHVARCEFQGQCPVGKVEQGSCFGICMTKQKWRDVIYKRVVSETTTWLAKLDPQRQQHCQLGVWLTLHDAKQQSPTVDVVHVVYRPGRGVTDYSQDVPAWATSTAVHVELNVDILLQSKDDDDDDDGVNGHALHTQCTALLDALQLPPAHKLTSEVTEVSCHMHYFVGQTVQFHHPNGITFPHVAV